MSGEGVALAAAIALGAAQQQPTSPPAAQQQVDHSKAPRVHHWLWPGAVTVSPRPLPGTSGVPLHSTLFVEIEPGTTSDGAYDELDLATLEVRLDASLASGESKDPNVATDAHGSDATKDARVLVERGAFTAAARGQLFPASADSSLALYVEPVAPLAPSTTYELAVSVRSKSGLSIDSGSAHWSFSTRAVAESTTLELVGDVARTIHFDHRVFAGTLKPNFDTTELLRQVATNELAKSVVGVAPHPNVGSLERDWPLCGDYFTNDFFDGDPNFVRERETRRITKIVDVAPDASPDPTRSGRSPASPSPGTPQDLPHQLELTVADLPEAPLYGIPLGAPLAQDYAVGHRVLVVDDVHSVVATVTAIDDEHRLVRVRPAAPTSAANGADAHEPIRAADFHVFEPPPFPPDSPAVPGNFASRITRLVKLDPHGTPVFWFGRVDHEWDLVHRRFGRRLVVGFDRTPCDLSRSGIVNRVEGPKDWREWQEVVGTLTSHLIDRYGKECLDFYWSIFNEPDLRPIFWASDDATLLAFYDVTVDAVLGAFEGHGLPSERVKVGGLELGALAAEPPLLASFLDHCANEPNFLAVADARATPKAEPTFCSRRARELSEQHAGRGSPCDFVSLHEYKHASFALHQLKWARETALAIDRDRFGDLAVVSFETDPDWNPTRDPATRAMFLGNGFWPAWAADWTRRAIDAAFDDPAFAKHEALLTVWPLDQNLVGIPTLSTVLERRRDANEHEKNGAAGSTEFVTVPKDVFHFLEALGLASSDYFRLEASSKSQQSLDSNADDHGTPRPVVAGFGARRPDGLELFVYGHDPLDPENRDASARTVRVVLRGLFHAPSSVTSYALDAESDSFFAATRELAHDGTPLAPSDVDRLAQLARFEPQPNPPTIAAKDGTWELTLTVPSNGVRIVRADFASK